jgi:hypothetical protein
VATYETYPLVDHSPVDHGLIITTVAQNGSQEVVVNGPYTENQALAELARFAHQGNYTVDVKNSLVLRISDREVLIVHEGFLSKWTVRAVVGTYVDGAS